MRLLAHGGTSFSERHRIGPWTSIPREVLESTYGLPGDSMIYGLGVLDDCQPFLVIRVRQVTEIGRSYAYSLLLDPGRDVWVRFGWNAADLLRAILEDDIGEVLLLRPESLITKDLERRLRSLIPLQTPLAPVSDGSSSELFDQWVGAAFSNEPVVLSPDALGFAERPTYQKLIEQLYQFAQPCFRIGAGWLVGASGEHAVALGAHLVIDDQLDGPGSRARNADRGRQATDAWLTISQHSEFKDALLKLERLPFCEWKEARGASGADFLARLKLLAQLLNGHRLPDQLQALEQQFKDFPFLTSEIRRAAHTLVLSGTDSLSPIDTAVALRNFYEQGLEIGSVDAMRRLDPETLIRMVVEREVQERTASSGLLLPAEVEATVFVRLLGALPQYSDIPQLLIEATAFIVKHFNGTQLEMRLAELKEAVELRTKLTESPLRLWETFPDDHIFWQDLSEILKKAARDRARTQRAGWELEYLRYGNDPGGAQLSRNGIDNTKAAQLVDRYLQEVHNQTELAPLAKDWLAGLAGSPLRRTVGIADKVAVVESGISDHWLPFQILWAAYNDSPDSGELNSGLVNKRVTQEELNSLRHELLDMLREYPPRTKVPNLPRIVKLLVDLPLGFFTELSKLQRQVGTAAFARWIERLREVGEADLAAFETVCYCEESKQPLPENWLFRGFSEHKLEVLVDFLVFGGYATDDEFYRSRCEEILDTRHHLARLRKTVARVCKTGLREREKLENFVRRYGGHEPALVRLFACFPSILRQEIVTELALRNTEAFIKHAREIIDETQNGERLNIYRYAVLRYVQTCDVESKKKIVRWMLHTKTGLDIWIDRVLETADEQLIAEPDDPPEDKDDRQAESLYSTAQASTAATSLVGKSHEAQHSDKRGTHEESRSKTRPGLGQRVRSLLGSVFSDEPPPLDPEESNSTASHVKKDDS